MSLHYFLREDHSQLDDNLRLLVLYAQNGINFYIVCLIMDLSKLWIVYT